jgi:uncharacterized protein involved in propanediol utilization
MSNGNRLARGIGFAPAHHGEILQGMFHDSTGQLRRALVTLHYPERESCATFYPRSQGSDIACPPGMSKAHRAAVASMAEFASERSSVSGGSIQISSTVPRGVGMGSSTADVTAVIRAIADFHDATPSAEEIGGLAVRAEGASDPIMIDDRVVLFSQRDGIVLETLGAALPQMVVVGCNADPGSDGIDTMELALAAYTAADIDLFRWLRDELREAIATGDAERLGRVATASARISQRFLPKPALEFLLDVCRSLGGSGVQVAHSGTVAGVIFDSRVRGVVKSVERCMDRIERAGLPLTGVIGSFPATAGDAAPPPHRASVPAGRAAGRAGSFGGGTVTPSRPIDGVKPEPARP